MKLFETSFLLPSWEVWLTATLSSWKNRKKYQEFFVCEQNVLGLLTRSRIRFVNLWLVCI